MHANVAQEDELTVHDLCCEEFDAVDDAEGGEDGGEDGGPSGLAPIVLSKPIPGRNEPCWCGSGEKYKKCHLAADQGR